MSAQSGELSHRQLDGMHRNPSAQANWSGPVHLTASPSSPDQKPSKEEEMLLTLVVDDKGKEETY